MRCSAWAVAFFVACTAPVETPVEKRVEAPIEAPVTTDRARYALGEGPFGPETTIVTTFRAPAGRAVYLENCNDAVNVGLQRLSGTTWSHAWAVERNACLSPPIVVPAGGERTETIVVASGADAVVSSRRTETKIDAGTYRVVWIGVYKSFDMNARPFGEELPLEQRVSAPFTIAAAPPPDPTRPSPANRPPEILFVEPAHGAAVSGRAAIRIRFAKPVTPQLYVDGEWVEEASTATTDTVQYVPATRWSVARHEVRVIYQDEQRRTRWYAWSFTAE